MFHKYQGHRIVLPDVNVWNSHACETGQGKGGDLSLALQIYTNYDSEIYLDNISRY